MVYLNIYSSLFFTVSMPEVNIFQTVHCYNLTDNLISHAYDPELVLRLDDVVLFVSEDLSKEFIINGIQKKTKQIQDMELTVEEAAMATALCFMVPGMHCCTFITIDL